MFSTIDLLWDIVGVAVALVCIVAIGAAVLLFVDVWREYLGGR